MAESRENGKAGAKARAPRNAAAKPRVSSRSEAPPRAARKAAPTSRRVAAPKVKAPQPSKKTPLPSSRAGRKAATLAGKGPATLLNEEDQIRSAKHLPRDLPPRLFEEERFLFPESYGVNRIRLLVKDPEWLFAHWDVDPKSLGKMKKAMGERAMALSRLTLRVVDPTNGGSSDILLPPLARGWYIRADATRRSYKAQLGVTLPSGEFRQLAESNVVVTPRVGPSRERATRRITFGQAGRIPQAAGIAQRDEDLRSVDAAAGPWRAPSVDGAKPEAPTASAGLPAATRPAAAARAGASDAYRPGGASDVHRR